MNANQLKEEDITKGWRQRDKKKIENQNFKTSNSFFLLFLSILENSKHNFCHKEASGIVFFVFNFYFTMRI
jgi:hypothetical protein